MNADHKMQKEINKLLKQLSAANLRGNHKECIELNNIVGGLYTEVGSYSEAIHYHEEALKLCKTLGDRTNTALCHRYIGEGKASLGNYEEGIMHIKTYVDLAQKTNDKPEVQRAWTTLGRIYLMQAQSLHEGEQSSARTRTKRAIAGEAEKYFQIALNMAQSVRDLVDDKEYSSMVSGLFINMGIVKDIRGSREESVAKFNRSAEIARSKKLKEELYRCCVIAAPIYRRWNSTKLAVKASEEALQVAKSIGRKLLICEALMELGLTRICQRDFKNAKRTFAQAYLEKSPSEDDHLKAVRLTKLSHLICINYEKLCKETTSSDGRTKLCDKLGDLFHEIGNYYLAAEFYKQAYMSAKACSASPSEKARLIFSVAECYADAEQYQHAYQCFQKEAALREGNPKEQCSTFIKIAHMMEYLDKAPDDVCRQYEKALEKGEKDPKLMHSVLRWYVPYLELKGCNPSRLNEVQELFTNLESYPEVMEGVEEEDHEEADGLEDEIANVDDVITDDEDNDEVLMVGRRRTKGSNKFKQNEVGDTPLHEAAIKGDLKRVKSLISQGHEVNPRDNAGWIPLHESCNHGHYAIAEYLIEQGADVDFRGLKGVTPLHDAATNGHYNIMRLLIKNGANVLMLTDTGENVLTCLRDYKSRNYSTMSNSEMSEYKQMEAELLNIMDKCGYGLMSDGNMKQPKPSGAKGSSYRAPDSFQPTRSKALSSQSSKKVFDPVTQSSGCSSLASSNKVRPDASSVRQYRDAIGTLKRKRPLEEQQPSRKASQPATIRTNYDPSVSTKNWLLSDDIIEAEDDDDDEEEDLLIAAQRRGALKSDWRSNKNSKNVLDDDGEEDGALFGSSENLPEINSTQRTDRPPSKPRTIELTDDEGDDFEILTSPRRPSDNASRSRPSASPVGGASFNGSVHFNEGSNFSFSKPPSEVLSKPLNVTIGDRKLLIPIKDEKMTVADLKQSIVSRYSILVDAEPKISLAPQSDTNCLLFDDDLCKDVVREDLVANIICWQIPSIEESYLKFCEKENIEPVKFIKIEMRNLDERGTMLDLSFVRFPAAHRQAVAEALARRDFVSADLQGSVSLFERHHTNRGPQASAFMNSITSWTKLTRLNLKGTGLLRLHFEHFCNANSSALPELRELDVSYNSINYRKREEFTAAVGLLHRACAKLRLLNVSNNILQFIDLFPEEQVAELISEHIEVVLGQRNGSKQCVQANE